jgi:hypothetical protein
MYAEEGYEDYGEYEDQYVDPSQPQAQGDKGKGYFFIGSAKQHGNQNCYSCCVMQSQIWILRHCFLDGLKMNSIFGGPDRRLLTCNV